jgi:hypothetical protein
MKTTIYGYITVLCIMFLLISPQVAANGDSNDTDDEGTDSGDVCFISSFCSLIIFLIILIYLSKRKSKDLSEERANRQYQPPTHGHGYRHPVAHKAYSSQPYAPHPPQLMPQKKDVKCDRCASKNIQAFEDGYFKCKECRHVFYISEGYRYKKQ